MDALSRPMLVTLVCVGAALAAGQLSGGGFPSAAGPSDTVEVSPEARAAGLRFAATVAEPDRAWILGSVAAARPEARRLIDEIDGLIEVRTHAGDPLGVTRTSRRGSEAHFVIDLDVASLNGLRVIDREMVVLHELGHAIDHALVESQTNLALDAGIPSSGSCVEAAPALAGSCTHPEERFADTFAKWALRGGVSALGAGYGVPTPASLEEWGLQLGGLAAGLPSS